MSAREGDPAPWFIVVADDHGHERAYTARGGEPPAPVQYSRITGSSTLLQKGLGRAARIASAPRVMATLLGGYRIFWEPSLWFVRPEHRFISPDRSFSPLAVASAIVRISETDASNVVVISPARIHVSRESVLESTIRSAVKMLPTVPKGVLTLAVLDPEEGVDENYLILEHTNRKVLGVARRPNSWVARHLREQGAPVASGIMVGYAGAFAAHITRQWPGLTHQLSLINQRATVASAECQITTSSLHRVSRWAHQSLRWLTPVLKQRAICVEGCGWNGLHSARAVARMNEYLAAVERFRRVEKIA